MKARIKTALALCAFTLVWSGLWYAAQIWSDQFISTFINREKDQGREWSCVNWRNSGYPIALSKKCESGNITLGANGVIHLAEIAAGWALSAPDYAEAVLVAPAEFNMLDSRVEGEWRSWHTHFKGIFSKDIAAYSDVQAPHFIWNGKSNRFDIQAEDVALSLVPGELRPENNRLPFEISMTGVKNNELAKLLAASAPMNFQFSGVLDHLDFAVEKDLRVLLEHWREKSGALTVTNVSIVSGTLSLKAHGRLGLDGLRRLQGNMEVEVSGADALLENYGLSPKSGIIGGLVSGLFKGTTVNGVVKAKTLPLRFTEGKIYLGPIALPIVLLPLY